MTASRSYEIITDVTGVVTNRYSYDAWGRPRDPQTWALKTIGVIAPLSDLANMQPRFDRGYTGHEMLCGFGLINMNGRLYDPYLQRFLSPDPTVQDPDNSQNYNRYSYCVNNPLRYIDPDGMRYAYFFGLIPYKIHEQKAPAGKKVETDYNQFLGHSNLFGLTYPGPNNPYYRDGNGNKIPVYDFDNLSSELEYPAIEHDEAYDRKGASGIIGLAFDPHTCFDDRKFVFENCTIAFEASLKFDLKTHFEGAILGTGLYLIGFSKTGLIPLSSTYDFTVDYTMNMVLPTIEYFIKPVANISSYLTDFNFQQTYNPVYGTKFVVNSSVDLVRSTFDHSVQVTQNIFKSISRVFKRFF